MDFLEAKRMGREREAEFGVIEFGREAAMTSEGSDKGRE